MTLSRSDVSGFPKLSRLSLGCVTFGREIDETQSHELMSHAAARGMTHFDTASAYSAGDSERIVGAWLAAHLDQAFTALAENDPGLIAELDAG